MGKKLSVEQRVALAKEDIVVSAREKNFALRLLPYLRGAGRVRHYPRPRRPLPEVHRGRRDREPGGRGREVCGRALWY